EDLHASEERMRGILSTIDDVVWSVSLPDAKVLFLNHAAERLFGRPVDDFVNDPRLWVEAIHPDDRGRALAAQEAALRSGTADYRHRIVRPDGTIRHAQMRCWVAFGAGGQPARLEGLLTDITERVESEERKGELER